MGAENTTWPGFSDGGKATVEKNTRIRRKTNPKSRNVRVTLRDESIKVNHLSKVV